MGSGSLREWTSLGEECPQVSNWMEDVRLPDQPSLRDLEHEFDRSKGFRTADALLLAWRAVDAAFLSRRSQVPLDEVALNGVIEEALRGLEPALEARLVGVEPERVSFDPILRPEDLRSMVVQIAERENASGD